MKKLYAIDQNKFNELPEWVKAEIKDTLRVYDKVNIIYENEDFHVSVGLALTAGYAKDHEFIGTAYADDFYSIDERKEIYKQEFGYYPGWGRDYMEKQRTKEANKTFIR